MVCCNIAVQTPQHPREPGWEEKAGPEGQGKAQGSCGPPCTHPSQHAAPFWGKQHDTWGLQAGERRGSSTRISTS